MKIDLLYFAAFVQTYLREVLIMKNDLLLWVSAARQEGLFAAELARFVGQSVLTRRCKWDMR